MKIQNPFRIGLFGGLGVIVAMALGATVGSLATILTYVGAALFLALGLDPLVTWLEKHKFPRWLAILTVLVAVLGVFAGLIFAIIPVIVEQVQNAVDTVPDLIKGIQDGTVKENILNALPWLPIDDLLTQAENAFKDFDIATIGGGVLTVGIGIAAGITGAVVVLILTLYFVSSLSSIKRGLYQLVPASRRPQFIDIAEQIATAVGRYVIGQGSLALANGVLSFIVLTLVFPGIGSLVYPESGLPISYSALLAFIAFLGSLIPLVGTISGSVIITLLVLLFDGAPSVIWVGIYYLAYMQLEAYVLNPRIMSQAVKVPGAIVVIAALAGGTLLGILGALIAIPVAAAILLIVRQVVMPRQNEL
ncbi:MAG: family transporter [Rhodoglobus sp.]|nr:family transporter [Rhodoglobus sp.]